jgi:hypothetical protein
MNASILHGEPFPKRKGEKKKAAIQHNTGL